MGNEQSSKFILVPTEMVDCKICADLGGTTISHPTVFNELFRHVRQHEEQMKILHGPEFEATNFMEICFPRYRSDRGDPVAMAGTEKVDASME